MSLQVGATVFFLKPQEFVLVEQVAKQYPFLNYVEFRGELPFMVPGQVKTENLDFYKTILKRAGLRSTMHSTMYGINLATLNPWLMEANIRCYKKYIDLCEYLETEILVVHAGYLTPEFARSEQSDLFWEQARKHLCQSLIELGDYARGKGVRIALENAPPEAAFPLVRGADEHIEILEAAAHTHVRALLDIGHAFILGLDPMSYLEQIQPYLIEIHAHNNRGEKDDHLALTDGKIDYEPLLRHPAAKGIPVIMELTSYPDVVASLEWLKTKVL